MGVNDSTRVNNSWYNGEFALFGMFGRADYAYQDKYLATVAETVFPVSLNQIVTEHSPSGL